MLPSPDISNAKSKSKQSFLKHKGEAGGCGNEENRHELSSSHSSQVPFKETAPLPLQKEKKKGQQKLFKQTTDAV